MKAFRKILDTAIIIIGVIMIIKFFNGKLLFPPTLSGIAFICIGINGYLCTSKK